MTDTAKTQGPRWARKIPTKGGETVHVVALRDGAATALCRPSMRVSEGTQFTTAQVEDASHLTKCAGCSRRGY